MTAIEPARRPAPLREPVGLQTAFARTHGPLRDRVAAALRAGIQDGRFPPGSRLPAERSLASRLGVSRITVVSAYERLRDEGLVERRRGSGTRVASRPPGAEPWVGSGVHRLMGHGAAPSEYGALLDRPVGFTIAALPGADALLEAARTTVADELPRLLGEFGYAPHGHQPLREAIAARHTTQGLPTRPEEILITTGAQQGLSLIVTLLAGTGSSAIVEDPTYAGILDALRAVGATPVGVPVDANGAMDAPLADLVVRTAPRLVYLVPAYHNPTGTVLSHERAERICRVAARFGVPIVDDRTLADLGWGSGDEPPMLASMTDGPVITVGSLSKVLWGGLRIGWVRAPVPMVDRLARLKLAVDNGGSLVSQAIAVAAMDRIDEMVTVRHAQAAERYAVLAERLAAEIPEWRWAPPSGGLSIWLRAPGMQAAAFAELAYSHGVIVVPGPVFSADGRHTDRLRLTFGDDPDRIEAGVAALARAWREWQGARA